jgi:hypothetical protein
MRRIAHLFAMATGNARSRSHSRRGHASPVLVSGLGAVGLAAAAAGTWRVPEAEHDRPPRAPAVAAAVAPGDTVTIWGPRQFNGSSGQGQTYVEAFTATVTPGRLYTLHLVNGAPNGTQRASKVTVTLNGFQVVAQNEVTQSVAQLDRVVAITAVDTIRVTVAGSGNPFITLSVLSTAPPEFLAYGPTQFPIPSGTTKTYNETYAIGGPTGHPSASM